MGYVVLYLPEIDIDIVFKDPVLFDFDKCESNDKKLRNTTFQIPQRSPWTISHFDMSSEHPCTSYISNPGFSGGEFYIGMGANNVRYITGPRNHLSTSAARKNRETKRVCQKYVTLMYINPA